MKNGKVFENKGGIQFIYNIILIVVLKFYVLNHLYKEEDLVGMKAVMSMEQRDVEEAGILNELVFP